MTKYQSPQLNVSDLQEWIAKQRVMYARCSKGEKTLYCTLNGSFEVEYKGEIIWQGMQQFAAVEAFNEPELILEQKKINQ